VVKLSKKELSEISVLENGGGTGILCLLAREAGAKTVIYNDIYNLACIDYKQLSKFLNLEPDHIISGEMKEIVDYLNEHDVNCDVIASRNVIEHIYNLDAYFHTASKLPNKNVILFLATTANQKNILTDIYTRRLQKKSELQDRKKLWGAKERDSYQSYSSIRESIIGDHFKTLSPQDIKSLAELTRGLIKEDIITAVEEYVQTGIRPKILKHPTNTCDPMTGNWTEHLLSIEEYKELTAKNNFSLEVKSGFYNTQYQLKLLNLITPIVNMFIKLIPSLGLYAAPFMVLYCKRSD